VSKQCAEQSAGTGRAHNLRVSVHIAVAVSPDSDLYGDGVNAAARVRRRPNQGKWSSARCVAQLRSPEFPFEALGDRSLKG
jgi:class 3 adenylate cyclase